MDCLLPQSKIHAAMCAPKSPPKHTQIRDGRTRKVTNPGPTAVNIQTNRNQRAHFASNMSAITTRGTIMDNHRTRVFLAIGQTYTYTCVLVLYCRAYLYIYIALLTVHTNQKRFQCERP